MSKTKMKYPGNIMVYCLRMKALDKKEEFKVQLRHFPAR